MADSSIASIRYASNLKKVRTCRNCGAKSDTAKWYPNITTHCAACWCKEVKARRDADIETHRAKDRMRADQPQRVQARKAYQLTVSKERKEQYIKKYWAKNPEKRAAHVALGNAVRDGKIIKPSSCEACGALCSAEKSLHAHHKDYSRPYEVTWMCVKCHGMHHRTENEIRRQARLGARMAAAE